MSSKVGLQRLVLCQAFKVEEVIVVLLSLKVNCSRTELLDYRTKTLPDSCWLVAVATWKVVWLCEERASQAVLNAFDLMQKGKSPSC